MPVAAIVAPIVVVVVIALVIGGAVLGFVFVRLVLVVCLFGILTNQTISQVWL